MTGNTKNIALEKKEAELIAENKRLSGILEDYLAKHDLDRDKIAAFETDLSKEEAQIWTEERQQLNYAVSGQTVAAARNLIAQETTLANNISHLAIPGKNLIKI